MSFAAALEEASKIAVCSWLANGGNALAATWIVNGSKTPWTAVAGGAAALGLLAVNYGCNYDPNTGGPTAGAVYPAGCQEVQTGNLLKLATASNSSAFGGNFRKFVSLINTGRPGNNGTTYWQLKVILSTGAEQVWELPRTAAEIAAHKFWTLTGAVCVDPGGDGTWTPDPVPPITYTDQVTNCVYNVELDSWLLEPGGTAKPVLKISAGAQAKATGGVIGGCNFSPVIHLPGGGDGSGGGGGGCDGPITLPWAPGPDGPNDEPWWWDAVSGAVGSVVGAAVNRLIDGLLEEKLPADVYRLVSVCEVDAQGEAVSQTREVQLPSVSKLDGIIDRLDAMEVLLQGLKDFKQPICGKKKATGELVTVNFNSHPDEVPSKLQVTKQLRYRDQSGQPESFHVDHWRDFVWQTGPVIVTSRGAAWGVVQVWASTSDEGRRVISHAAAAASVSLGVPDHKWEITSPKDPRYGREATVYPIKFDATGLVMVCKRDGASGRPRWMLDP